MKSVRDTLKSVLIHGKSNLLLFGKLLSLFNSSLVSSWSIAKGTCFKVLKGAAHKNYNYLKVNDRPSSLQSSRAS